MFATSLLVGLLAAANAALLHYLVHSYLAARVTRRIEELRTGRPERQTPRVPDGLTDVQPQGRRMTDPGRWPMVRRDAESMTRLHRWLAAATTAQMDATDATVAAHLDALSEQ